MAAAVFNDQDLIMNSKGHMKKCSETQTSQSHLAPLPCADKEGSQANVNPWNDP